MDGNEIEEYSMKNFIWDFDGTLFDTYTHTVTILHNLMAEEGMPCDYDILYAKSRRGLGEARDYCKATDAQWKEFYRREGFIELEPIAKPYDGAEEMLKRVVAEGCNNYIYTHRDAVTFKYLREYGWMEYFKGFVTNEHNFPHKPAPDALFYLIKKYNMIPEETVMIGDREIDVLSGKNAGIHACLFTEGNTDIQYIEQIKSTKADFVANNMSSLCSLFFPTVL